MGITAAYNFDKTFDKKIKQKEGKDLESINQAPHLTQDTNGKVKIDEIVCWLEISYLVIYVYIARLQCGPHNLFWC